MLFIPHGYMREVRQYPEVNLNTDDNESASKTNRAVVYFFQNDSKMGSKIGIYFFAKNYISDFTLFSSKTTKYETRQQPLASTFNHFQNT